MRPRSRGYDVVTLYQRAERFVGVVVERPGDDDHPLIRWWHSLTTYGEAADEVPWCSSFVNGMCWELRLPRSKSAAARSWLHVGVAVEPDDAEVGFDVVVLSRGSSPTAGHVGFFSGYAGDRVYLLGGTQADAGTGAGYPVERVIGVRRLTTTSWSAHEDVPPSR